MAVYMRLVPRIVFLIASTCLADQVTLSNGDRLTGSVLKSDEKTLTLKSEFAGTVTIDWKAVSSIDSSDPLWVTLSSGQIVIGPVRSSNGRLEIRTTDAGTVATSKDQVKTVRSKAEQDAYTAEIERYRNPRLLDLWTGFVDTGLSLARGNADTTNFSVGMNATRATKRDKIAVYFTSIYAKNTTLGRSVLSADAIRGGIRYDLNISEKNFAFAFTDQEYDKFQSLDLRAVFGGGLGRHVVKTEKAMFDLFGGGSLDREFFSTGLRRTSGEVLAGEEFTQKLAKTTSIQEKLVVFPNVSDIGQFRVTFDAGTATTIRKWLAFQVTASDRYLSNPIAHKKNDLLLTTGIRLTFAR